MEFSFLALSLISFEARNDVLMLPDQKRIIMKKKWAKPVVWVMIAGGADNQPVAKNNEPASGANGSRRS